ncbi:hypothetical protein BDW02DRAFT_414693 [Decorospora gaudefroyi]|uniref:Uncharacterized protein n=1 Tax=Decorospora gaudefroyi TaxID=184978 RepID=A0A6A5KT32_9PLEO|nr:hypothetical protein BDW02DRAFT_414693 [Decorospora gaudefroyi]
MEVAAALAACRLDDDGRIRGNEGLGKRGEPPHHHLESFHQSRCDVASDIALQSGHTHNTALLHKFSLNGSIREEKANGAAHRPVVFTQVPLGPSSPAALHSYSAFRRSPPAQPHMRGHANNKTTALYVRYMPSYEGTVTVARPPAKVAEHHVKANLTTWLATSRAGSGPDRKRTYCQHSKTLDFTAERDLAISHTCNLRSNTLEACEVLMTQLSYCPIVPRP